MFVDMSRIEGYLAAFPKLVGTGKQHTYVEIENMRRGICKTAFELIFAFDEIISLGHKENVTVAHVKQYCEMESHEEKLHKLVLQRKINDTKDVMKGKSSEIDKSKLIEKNRGEKGGFMSLKSMGSGRIDTDFDSRPAASATTPPKGLGMQLGKTQRTSQFLESLKAEGEVIVEDVRPSIGQSKPTAPPPTDPVTLTVEEKINVTLKRDDDINNFNVQGTLSLQIQNQDDGLIQVQFSGRPHVYNRLMDSGGDTLNFKHSPFYIKDKSCGLERHLHRSYCDRSFKAELVLYKAANISGMLAIV
ncbi:hypothetical protein RND71_042311 [Anisodus tanguticus]|uniref:Coatomer subunit delta n=1 Tax=Anisodus tanguticus TaxID=243964 RepID=A0AAE1UUP2_9SOLA|nr:hypothetical protein RND71_042311 [Anisodus tanguticus]